jgi:hypothetical protein
MPQRLAGLGMVGLEESLTERGRDHALLALGDVSQGIPHPMDDPYAIDAVRFVTSVPFPGAGPIQRRQRRDARFPRT